MIETYKIMNGKYDPVASEGLFIRRDSHTRGHSLKLTKRHVSTNLRKFFFSNRVVNSWNTLPETIALAPNTQVFESRLDKHWALHPLKYCIT